MHGDGLLDDEAIGDELADRLAGVGVGDLADLVGVEPNLALTAAQDGRRQALLGPQVNPTEPKTSASCRSVCILILFFFDGRVCLEVCVCSTEIGDSTRAVSSAVRSVCTEELAIVPPKLAGL